MQLIKSFPFSHPILKLWDTQGYLWLPYDLTEVIKVNGETFELKQKQENTLSFLLHYCHSFYITVIPSGLLSFFPDYCHSFCISCHSFQIFSFLPNYCHQFWDYLLVFQNMLAPSSKSFPYLKGEINGHFCSRSFFNVQI
jgi:hypothetical protein